MKKHKCFLMVTLTGILMLSIISIAEAIPPLPSSFYGSVKVNDDNIPEGAILKAVIDNHEFALAIVEIFEGESVYSLDIPGDDPATPNVIEGGKSGDTIRFLFGDNPANETGSWVGGTNVKLDLTFNQPVPPVMPANFYGSVKINNENPPEGTIIKAIVNDVTLAACSVSHYSGNVIFAISVPGDDPSTSGSIEGGVNGDIVHFLINHTSADQRGTWVSGSNAVINLTATVPIEGNLYYFPLFYK